MCGWIVPDELAAGTRERICIHGVITRMREVTEPGKDSGGQNRVAIRTKARNSLCHAGRGIGEGEEERDTQEYASSLPESVHHLMASHPLVLIQGYADTETVPRQLFFNLV